MLNKFYSRLDNFLESELYFRLCLSKKTDKSHGKKACEQLRKWKLKKNIVNNFHLLTEN